MKARPPGGTTHQVQFTVGPADIIDFATEGMPAVLATPKLIGWLERTAREALHPFLDERERTVGMEIELRHLAPTPQGATCTCLARVISSEGPFVTFHLEARDGQELIARGIHKRAVVGIDQFARRVASKSGV